MLHTEVLAPNDKSIFWLISVPAMLNESLVPFSETDLVKSSNLESILKFTLKSSLSCLSKDIPISVSEMSICLICRSDKSTEERSIFLDLQRKIIHYYSIVQVFLFYLYYW